MDGGSALVERTLGELTYQVGYWAGQVDAFTESHHTGETCRSKPPLFDSGCEACRRQLARYVRRSHMAIPLALFGEAFMAEVKFSNLVAIGAAARAKREATRQPESGNG